MRTRKTTSVKEGGGGRRKGKERVDELTRVRDVVAWRREDTGNREGVKPAERRRREEIAMYVIRGSNCCRHVTSDYFLIAAIKRTRSPRIGERIARV